MFDIDAMSLEILNRQTEERDLPEELAAVKAELRVYQDMQANLNTNLAMFPDFLDTIEDLQCTVYPPDDVWLPPQLPCKHSNTCEELQEKLDTQTRQIGIYDITLQVALENELQLEQELAKSRAQTQLTQDYRDNANLWREAYYKKPLADYSDKALTREEWEDTYHKFWVGQEAFFKLKKQYKQPS